MQSISECVVRRHVLGYNGGKPVREIALEPLPANAQKAGSWFAPGRKLSIQSLAKQPARLFVRGRYALVLYEMFSYVPLFFGRLAHLQT